MNSFPSGFLECFVRKNVLFSIDFCFKLRTNAVRQQIDAFLKGALGLDGLGSPKRMGGL